MTAAVKSLRPLLAPRSIAIVGASLSMNRASGVLRNLQKYGYVGTIYPINPKYEEVGGVKCYPSLSATPEPADCAVIAIAKEYVLPVLEEAVRAGVRAAIILSSGFGESDEAGRARQEALEALVARTGLLCCGPNCFGIVNIRLRAMAYSGELLQPLRAGGIGLVSQSGGFTSTIVDQLMPVRGVGFSYIVSCGNQVGVSLEDYIDFLADDEDTRVIGIFAEGFKQPERLREVIAKARANGKPVVVLRTGRSDNARQAALTHTGVLAGANRVVDAALKQFGAVQVSTLGDMIETLALFSSLRDYQGQGRVAVLTGFGGQCGYFADAADRVGVELPALSDATREKLAGILPDFATPRNPIDGTGAMYEDRTLFPRLLRTLLDDDDFDVIAVHLNAELVRPSGRSASRGFAQQLCEEVERAGGINGRKRLICCFSSISGGARDPETLDMLAKAGIPFLDGTNRAVHAIKAVVEFAQFGRAQSAANNSDPDTRSDAEPAVGAMMDAEEARRLIASYGVSLVETEIATSPPEAEKIADRVGYPVVLKIASPDIQHKTDVGGVRLGLTSAASVRDAFGAIVGNVKSGMPQVRINGVAVQRSVSGQEIIVGTHKDPQFGPVVLVGLGGIFVEVLEDVAVRLAPVSEEEAERMLGELKGRALLDGARGKPPVDIPALRSAIAAISQLAWKERHVVNAIDVNPLVALPQGKGAVAVDWLVSIEPMASGHG